MRYYKGHSKIDGRQMIFEYYEEPQIGLFDESYQVIASAIEKTGDKEYPSLLECEKENYVQREITETEYESYRLIQKLLTEMFMNQFTGGFPRKKVIHSVMRELPRKIAEYECETL